VICVALFTVYEAAFVLPNFTTVVPVRFVPVRDTVVPPEIVPVAGERLITWGRPA
jgi:hypothetical protein